MKIKMSCFKKENLKNLVSLYHPTSIFNLCSSYVKWKPIAVHCHTMLTRTFVKSQGMSVYQLWLTAMQTNPTIIACLQWRVLCNMPVITFR